MFRKRLTVLSSMSRLAAVVLVAGLLIVVWVVVFAAGGTRTALPHLFYLPVVAAVMPLGRRGGIAAGVAATVLCGPLMPLDVYAGLAQTPGNWLVRGLFFVIVGGLAGTAARAATAGFEQDLTLHLAAELARTEPEGAGPADVAVLRELLDDEQFTVVFQPIYDLDDGRLLAVEALSRFRDASVQSPATWFAQAAEVGLGVDLELATARKALGVTADLPGWVALALNVSPACAMDIRLVELLQRHARRRLVIELTEHAVVDDYAALRVSLDGLRSHGVRVAVDDAGAGFASLQHIVRLEPDIIKLDLSLTQNVRDDPVRRALASALVQFAEHTGTQLIAEGVETPADLEIWQDIGAHAAQGYLLGRPGPWPVPLDACPSLSSRRVPRTLPPDLVQARR